MNKIFDAPIPGQSLTQPRAGSPMERPPQFTDADEALQYLFDRLTQPKHLLKLMAMLKSGMPVEYLTRTVLFEGVMQGKWTPDLALLMAQVVTWQIEAIAKLKGIKTELKNPDDETDDFMRQYYDLLDNKEEAPTEDTSPGFFFKGGK